MRIIHSLDAMTELARGWLTGGSVGFVPIMSPFHDGHKSLVLASRSMCETTVVGIMANSLTPDEWVDSTLSQRPRDLTHDLQELSTLEVDVVFIPRIDALRPPEFSIYVTPAGPFAEQLQRVYHMGIVREFATIMTKLLLLVRPDIAFLGRKDAPQVALVRQLVRDLNIDVSLHILPTIREPDGLALGSRNYDLTVDERQAAVVLYRALMLGKACIEQGEMRTSEVQKVIAGLVSQEPLTTLVYAIACQPETLTPVEEIKPGTLLALCVKVGKVDLIDNILWAENESWHI